jgi:hypothetical protein
MFSVIGNFGDGRLMSKKKNDSKSRIDRPTDAEPAPPHLSEKLIAQLQHAVAAARRKQMPTPSDGSEHRSARNSGFADKPADGV